MFKKIKKINTVDTKYKTKIELSKIKEGSNLFNEFIIYKDKENLSVFDRKCDHSGGKIISRDGTHICPLHNWKFNPKIGKYNNGVTKRKLKFLKKNDNLIIQNTETIPKLLTTNKLNKVKIRFVNHAFVIFESENIKFATDPWAIGPAFANGWWLKKPTHVDWIKELNSCNFIFVSHNHPDHLNKLTLSKIRRDMLFLIPDFFTDSTGIFLEELGFKNLFRAKFLYEYKFLNSDLTFCILKSGDFREDSGIYFTLGKFSALLDVDSNSINFMRLPKVTFYASSFAGGSTGFPIVFENYSESEKKIILNNNIKILKKLKFNNLKKIRPDFFMPYAGFFSEEMERDKYIKTNNIKNKIENYKIFCDKNKINLLNVNYYQIFEFEGENLVSQKKQTKNKRLSFENKKYFNAIRKNYNQINEKYIKSYFLDSKFEDNLILYISLTNDNFKKIIAMYKIDFSKELIRFNKIKKISFSKKTVKYLHITSRVDAFLETVYNKNPWEDLMIGFQCKIFRIPNEYNIDFWHHFSNIYVTSKNVRTSNKCLKCIKLNQKIVNEMII